MTILPTEPDSPAPPSRPAGHEGASLHVSRFSPMTAPPASPTLSPVEVAERADARDLTPADAVRLLRASRAELVSVMAAASLLRDRYHGQTVTYSRKVFIPLTNLCRDACGYCTFARPPGDPKARTLTPDDVLTIARAGRD